MDYFFCCSPIFRILRSFKANDGQRGTELSTNSASESNSIKDGNEEDQDSGTASGDHGHAARETDALLSAVPPSVPEKDLQSEDAPPPQGESEYKNDLNAAHNVEAAAMEGEGPKADSETAGEHGRERDREPQHERHEHGNDDDKNERNRESDESWRDQMNHGHGHDQFDNRPRHGHGDDRNHD